MTSNKNKNQNNKKIAKRNINFNKNKELFSWADKVLIIIESRLIGGTL